MRPTSAFFLSMIVAGYALCSGGCAGDSAQRLAALETIVTQTRAAVDAAAVQVTALQAQLASAKEAGADSATLAKIMAGVDEAMSHKGAVTDFLRKAEVDLAKAREHPTVGNEIQTYGSLAAGAVGLGLAEYFRRQAKRAKGTA